MLDTVQQTQERCGCACGCEHVIDVRSGSVECRYCYKQIHPDCCVAVPVDAEDHKVEFRCHYANGECPR